MKNKNIQLLLSEIQKLESKVANLKENQNVSFSFFKESFKQTQEISRLLHELEFTQIEDMKSQMGKLVQFLYESETSTVSEKEAEKDEEDIKEVLDNGIITKEEKEDVVQEVIEEVLDKSKIQGGVFPTPFKSSSKERFNKEIKEDFPQFEDEKKDEEKDGMSEGIVFESNNESQLRGFIKEDSPIASDINPLNSKIKSLNDFQTANHSILDIKRSISLNDRFLFQRELFDNDRHAMNNMMLKLQAFNTYEDSERYLKENTNWNFEDENVEKFLEMLKKSS